MGGATAKTENKPLMSMQWKLIIAAIALVAVVLLYQFNHWFHLNFPILVILAIVALGWRFASVRAARTREKLLRTIRSRLPNFQVSNDFRGHENQTGILFDAKRFELAIYENSGRRVGAFTHREIVRSEVVEDGGSVTSTSRGSQLVGAAVGAALVGGLGFVVGGLSGKKTSQSNVSKVSVDVTVKNVEQPLWTVVLLDSKKPVLRSSTEGKDAIQTAKEIHALLGVFIRKADDEDKATPSVQTQAPIAASSANNQSKSMDVSAIAAELTKLAKMKEQGLLDDSEFIEMKKAVLERAKGRLSA